MIHCAARRGCAGVASRPPRLITTPIFYVNASPHIGHLHSALLCDVLARWRRMKGERVVFSTGTDEHGSKVLSAAAAQGEAVEDFCERVSSTYRTTFDAYEISYDRFIRTTEERHRETVLRFWERLSRSEYVYEGSHAGWYCKSDEAFLSEEETALADGTDGGDCMPVERDAPRVSLESGHPVEWLDEMNYKFKLGDRALQERVTQWLSSTPSPIAPASKLNEALAMLRPSSGADGAGIPDVAISRPVARVEWGINIPSDGGASGHTVYVWLDALLNYLTVAEEASASAGACSSSSSSSSLAAMGGATHVLGKDILKFHGIYWPAFLLAAGMAPPERLFVHGHWTVGRVKMSKSLGNVVDPNALLETYGSETVRYYLLSEGGNARGNDAHFSESELTERLNAELADTLGNLAARCTATALTRALASSPPDASASDDGGSALGTTALAPPPSAALRAEDEDFIAAMRAHSAEVPALYERLAVSDALRNVFDMLREANRYFSANEPWKLKASLANDADDAARRERLQTVLYLSVEAVRLSASLLSPVLPQTSQTLLDHVLGDGETNAALRGVSISGDSPSPSSDDSGEQSRQHVASIHVEGSGYGRAEDSAPSTCAFQADATFQLAPAKLKLFAKV